MPLYQSQNKFKAEASSGNLFCPPLKQTETEGLQLRAMVMGCPCLRTGWDRLVTLHCLFRGVFFIKAFTVQDFCL